MAIRRIVAISVAATLAGVVTLAVGPAARLDEALTLGAFTSVRGRGEPPRHVAIVTIDEATAARLQLPSAMREWPRSVYADLVDRLVDAGASAIAFDIEFFRHSADAQEDERFGAAIERAQRVVLVQRIRRARMGGQAVWEHQMPVPRLSRGAALVAPVPVPDVPIVTSFWTYFATPEGELASLPAAMLQVHTSAVVPDLLRLLRRAGMSGVDAPSHGAASVDPVDDRTAVLIAIRRAMQADRSLARRVSALVRRDAGISPEDRRSLEALIAMLSGGPTWLLNLYGPPGSVCTVPFDELIEGQTGRSPRCALRGAAVFVGVGASRIGLANQPDTFHTIHTAGDADNLSGVELQATAFANLLTRSAVQPSSAMLTLILLTCCGASFAGGAYALRIRTAARARIRPRIRASAFAVAAAAAYVGGGYLLFSREGLLVPLAVPVVVQLPLGLVLALMIAAVRREETVTAVCLVSDAGGSTAVGDRLAHPAYGSLMKAYHAALCAPVHRHGGEALNPKGDGFLCVWVERGDASASTSRARFLSCVAALEMVAAADRLNGERPAAQRLPTRVGLHVGPVTIASDADRGTFDVVGQAANVAARLQMLNRTTGTRVLASDAVVAGLDDVLVLRRLDGAFSLDGIAAMPAVFEICGRLEAGRVRHVPMDVPAATGAA
jgi:adenylate cyclase